MGGQDGSRGYLFQAIIAVLNSLDDKDWDYVQIEPKTDKEKVDILWHYPNNKLKVTQVKSSINNFTKSDIISWSEKLYSDVSGAETYDIILIGNVSDSLKKELNKISSGKAVLSNKLQSLKGKLNIDIVAFNENLMFSGIQTGINKFVSSHNYTVDFYTLENIAGAITYQFFNFGISGKKVSRKEFTNKLLEWIRFNYSKIFGIQNKLNKLEISFYNNSKGIFASEITKLKYSNLIETITPKFKNEIEELIKEINAIKIIESKPSYGNVTIRDSDGNNLSIEYYDATISENKINDIIRQLKEIFNIDLSNDFFYLGKVLAPTSKISSIYDNDSNFYTGSKSEVEKRKKIDIFLDKIQIFLDFKIFLQSIEEFNIIPLVLRNIGNLFDEKIRVIIKLPKDIEFLSTNDLKIPNRLNSLNEIDNNKNFIKYIFKHYRDSLVLEYETKLRFKTSDFITNFMKPKEEKIKEQKENINNLIKSSFVFDYHTEDPDYTVLEFHFNELNPKENISFPCYLLAKVYYNFEINYEITSKNSHDKTTGKLIYKLK